MSADSITLTTTQMGPHATKPKDIKQGDSKDIIYYAVYIPPELIGTNSETDFAECERVFDNKEKALTFIKKNKKIRFNSFKNYQDARNFAFNGCFTNTGILNNSLIEQNSSSDPVSSSTAANISNNNLEKPSPFKSLKSQDLVKLRKLIEKGNLLEVKKLIWDNPKHLISSGDFPTILHEGCRYNALHVCAKTGNHEMMELLLDTIADPNFSDLLYETSGENQSYIERSHILLDLYVNTPDKGSNETALHFAAKHGALECVSLLVKCPQIQKNVRNKEGKTPLEIACSRCNDPSATAKKSLIQKLLSEDQFYVPVWSSSDICHPPMVGTPCKTNITPGKSIRKDENDVTSPSYEVKAYAGPMSETNARSFRNKWKREIQNSTLSPLNTSFSKTNTSLNSSHLSNTSIEKSFEIVGRRLAVENKVEWKEYWAFLEKSVDLQSQHGLELLENYICKKYHDDVLFYNNKTNVNTNLLIVGDENVSKHSSISPIEKLCHNFHTMTLSPTGVVSTSSYGSNVSNSSHSLIEKSCEAFSNRLLNGIKSAAYDKSKDSLIKTLRLEAKHLNNLCQSFTQDERFQNVSMNRLHNKVGQCLVQQLIGNMPPEAISWLMKVFNEIHQKKSLSGSTFGSPVSSICDNSGASNSSNQEEYHSTVLCLISQVITLFGSLCDSTSDFNGNSQQDNQSEEFFIHKNKNHVYSSSETEQDAEVNWNKTAPCHCSSTRSVLKNPNRNHFFNNVRSLNRNVNRLQFSQLKSKRLDFDSDSKDRSIAETRYNLSSYVSDSSDTDDEDEEYCTPANSICSEVNTMSSSEEEMYDALDEEPEIYLVGHSLSATDIDVLQTLAQCPIDVVKYPFIYKWKHFVNLKLSAPAPSNLNYSFLNNQYLSPVKCSPLSSKYQPLQHSTPSFIKEG